MIDERHVELVRRIPYVVVLVALVVANLAYAGAGPFVGLRSHFGYAMIADGTLLILAFPMLVIGKPQRVGRERLAEIGLVFLPEWTCAMLLSLLAAILLT
jgi:membrane protease YdiL (CAAX protease family)